MKAEAEIFKAMAHPMRLEILDQIGSGEVSVSDMKRDEEVSQSLLSQHLSVLRKVGLVTTRKESQRVYYSLNRGTLRDVKQALEGIENSA